MLLVRLVLVELALACLGLSGLDERPVLERREPVSEQVTLGLTEGGPRWKERKGQTSDEFARMKEGGGSKKRTSSCLQLSLNSSPS